MYKICIVEDQIDAAERLKTYVENYFGSKKEPCQVLCYSDPNRFLEYHPEDTDIVFMDIDFGSASPLNGMEAARRLRTSDQQVILIFVTNLAQYAVTGYEVDALAFCLKPIRQADIERKLDRAVNRLDKNTDSLVVSYDGRVSKLWTRDIRYIEVSNHKLSFHTINGTYFGSGTLQEMESAMSSKGFFKGNKWYLVNYRYIERIDLDQVILNNGETLPLSRLRKRELLNEITKFIGKENAI